MVKDTIAREKAALQELCGFHQKKIRLNTNIRNQTRKNENQS